jgi:hypothetical protein
VWGTPAIPDAQAWMLGLGPKKDEVQ